LRPITWRLNRNDEREVLSLPLHLLETSFSLHQTNQHGDLRTTCYADKALVSQHAPPREALQGTNLKKLLRTVEALADLGPELTADRDFGQTARKMLAAILEAAGAREAVLFSFGERPSVLNSVAAQGFALLPEPSVIP